MTSAVRPTLEWLISPFGRDEFFRDHWEQRPLVVNRQQPEYLGSLLNFDDVDRVITTLDRRYPDVVLKNANDPAMRSSDYTRPNGSLEVASLYHLFEKGSTVTLAFVDTLLPSLTILCRSLEQEFSCPFQSNVYMTPPGAQGAKPHYDTHDVFVLQVSGSKRWTLFGTPVESPLAGQEFSAEEHSLGETTLEFELQAGDVAYIPRGVAHEARSTDTVSLHITAGVLRYTWADFLLEAVAAASLENPAFRKALPLGFAQSGFDREQARAKMRELLEEAAQGPYFDAVLDGFIDRFISRCPPVLAGQMAQLAMLDSLTIEGHAGARAGVIVRIERNLTSDSVELSDRKITFPSRAGEAMRYALSHPDFVVKDLPGSLDDTGKLTLVRRLIREGLVVALPA